LIVSRFIDLIVRFVLSVRICRLAHSGFWIVEDTSDCIPFETVPAVSTKLDLRIIAHQ
jgi:hypothetical protein